MGWPESRWFKFNFWRTSCLLLTQPHNLGELTLWGLAESKVSWAVSSSDGKRFAVGLTRGGVWGEKLSFQFLRPKEEKGSWIFCPSPHRFPLDWELELRADEHVLSRTTLEAAHTWVLWEGSCGGTRITGRRPCLCSTGSATEPISLSETQLPLRGNQPD